MTEQYPCGGKSNRVYVNATASLQQISVTVTSTCGGDHSSIDVFDKNGSPVEGSYTRFAPPVEQPRWLWLQGLQCK
jgi:hypothetical protein